jgi:ribonuclease P protein component
MTVVKSSIAVAQRAENALLSVRKSSDMVNSAPTNLSTFSNDEVKTIFRSASIRKKFEGIDVLCAPQLSTWGRLLVVTPRKSGNAPQRNKIRRRLKAIFYEEKFFERGYDCVVFVKKEGINLSFDELKAMLMSVFAS